MTSHPTQVAGDGTMSRWADALRIGAVALVYFLVARLSSSLVFQPEGISALWPPTGVLLSALLLARRDLRTWMAAALFVADFLAESTAGVPPLVGLLYASALTGNAILGAWVLRRFAGESITFARVQEVVAWLLLSVVGSSVLLALVAAAATSLTLETSVWRTWMLHAATGGMGNLLVTPLAVSWAAWWRAGRRLGSPRRVTEWAFLAAMPAVLSHLALSGAAGHDSATLLLTYLIFPLLLWMAIRFGVRGVASAVTVVAGNGIWIAMAGRASSFALQGRPLETAVALQTYLAIMAVPALLLAAAVTERHRAQEQTHALVAELDASRLVLLSVIEDQKRTEAALSQLNAELERRVRTRTVDLTAANQELDSFAYAVSHDLRAPLRAMSGFSAAILEDHGASLPEGARRHLDRILAASRNMAELIDGLLLLSRTTRDELRCGRIDVSALADCLREEQARDEPARTVDWHIERGLTAWGDGRMIEVVLRNLIGNAWKYTARCAAPVVRVYAERQDGVTWYCVADNGAGFDMRHADRLFKPFQRLHRQDEYPGLGIGLATVQRVIHRHHGALSVAATPGQGATFRFSLPPGPDRTGVNEPPPA